MNNKRTFDERVRLERRRRRRACGGEHAVELQNPQTEHRPHRFDAHILRAVLARRRREHPVRAHPQHGGRERALQVVHDEVRRLVRRRERTEEAQVRRDRSRVATQRLEIDAAGLVARVALERVLAPVPARMGSHVRVEKLAALRQLHDDEAPGVALLHFDALRSAAVNEAQQDARPCVGVRLRKLVVHGAIHDAKATHRSASVAQADAPHVEGRGEPVLDWLLVLGAVVPRRVLRRFARRLRVALQRPQRFVRQLSRGELDAEVKRAVRREAFEEATWKKTRRKRK